jgi:hypothetical protein
LKIKKNGIASLANNINSKNTIMSNSSSLMSSTSSSTSSLAVNSNLVSNTGGRANSNIFNDIITKRIKYTASFVSSPSKNMSSQVSSSLQHSPYVEYSLNGSKNNKLIGSNGTNEFENDKATTSGYLSISLDSNKNNNSSQALIDMLQSKSSTFSQENLSSIQDSSIFSPLSPPNIFKKKRKKKDNSISTINSHQLSERNSDGIFRASSVDQQTNQKLTSSTQAHLNSLGALNSQSNQFNSDINIINLSNETGLTKSENQLKTAKSYSSNDDQVDPLQHMKNLDLNNDLGRLLFCVKSFIIILNFRIF